MASLAINIAKWIKKQPPNSFFIRVMRPMARWYVDSCGHRQLGLKYHDLYTEEDPIIYQAVKRLPPKELYDRGWRIRRATQLSLQHKILPKEEWTKPEDDTPYLLPLMEQIIAENKEREQLDSAEIVPKNRH